VSEGRTYVKRENPVMVERADGVRLSLSFHMHKVSLGIRQLVRIRTMKATCSNPNIHDADLQEEKASLFKIE
jgi:hypothetical protein